MLLFSLLHGVKEHNKMYSVVNRFAFVGQRWALHLPFLALQLTTRWHQPSPLETAGFRSGLCWQCVGVFCESLTEAALTIEKRRWEEEAVVLQYMKLSKRAKLLHKLLKLQLQYNQTWKMCLWFKLKQMFLGFFHWEFREELKLAYFHEKDNNVWHRQACLQMASWRISQKQRDCLCSY